MVKPIFLVGIPSSEGLEGLISEIQEKLEMKLDDYHVLLYIHKGGEIEFKCFHEKDFDEVELDKLKEIVIRQLPLRCVFC